ncbi:cysteine-rich protein 2-like [Ptychodera flava]|uniref:cysteine-rich protein 2-like n=1 Tax=Ptychodera flava TaxID=63121 RepID=UPI00396A93F1
MSTCPRCEKPVYFAERRTSLGKDWHQFCLKCAKCQKLLTPGSHAEHEGTPYCTRPCYSALFGPKGVRGFTSHSYVAFGKQLNGVELGFIDAIIVERDVFWFLFPILNTSTPLPIQLPTVEEFGFVSDIIGHNTQTVCVDKQNKKLLSTELLVNMPKCPSCKKEVYFAEKKTSLGHDWHAFCLKCKKCTKTLTPGSHAERDGVPYCNHCYASAFGPGGVRSGTSGADSYVKK